MRVAKATLTVCCFVGSASASAQSPEKEPAAIVEVGGAGNWSVKGGGSAFGPAVAVEATPIKNWLEREAGVTPLFAKGSTEWDTDLLFKKPWDISKHFEFMIGGGPEWVHSSNRNSLAAEAAIDLMFWPGAKHRFGMFVEPSYDYNFSRGHEQSFGVTAGLLIAIR